MRTATDRIEINGDVATIQDLSPLAFVNYGHSTAMQVRGGRVRGMELHLARLEEATRELFHVELGHERVRGYIRHALGGDVADATVRIYVFSADVFSADGADPPSVLVNVGEPSDMPATSRSLQTSVYQRPMPHLKHVGNFGKIHLSREAQRRGFDGVLLTTPDGVIAEGATTNIGMFDGCQIIWPEAPALHGVTMRIIEAHLPEYGLPTRRRRVHLSDLCGFRNVFVVNSRGIAPVCRIDDRWFPVDTTLMARLHQAYASAHWDEI